MNNENSPNSVELLLLRMFLFLVLAFAGVSITVGLYRVGAFNKEVWWSSVYFFAPILYFEVFLLGVSLCNKKISNRLADSLILFLGGDGKSLVPVFDIWLAMLHGLLFAFFLCGLVFFQLYLILLFLFLIMGPIDNARYKILSEK